MHDPVSTGRRTKRWAGAAGLLAAGAISGGVLASALSASASSNAPAAAASTVSSPAGQSEDAGTRRGPAGPARRKERLQRHGRDAAGGGAQGGSRWHRLPDRDRRR